MKNFFKSNINSLRKSKGLTQEKAATALGLKRNTYANYESGHSEPDIDTIIKIASFFGINVSDLLNFDIVNGKLIGEGMDDELLQNGNLNSKPLGKVNAKNDPVKTDKNGQKKAINSDVLPQIITVDSLGNENIVHVPVKARAGYLVGYGDPSYIESLYTYNLPGLRTGTYRSFEVEGQSMNPTLRDRDWVIASWVENLQNIRENRVHVVVTHNDGILIKRVLNRVEKRGKLYLKSDNINNKSDYPIIELDPSDIAEIWYANIKFSSDFSEPSEIFTRLNDLEIDVMALKKAAKG